MSGEVVLAARALRVERRARNARFTLEVEELSLRAGEALAILGPNGAGKSTLLRALAGLEEPEAGRVVCRASGPVTLVFQRPAAFSGSVLHNVSAALLGRGLPGAELRERSRQALSRFGVEHLAKRRAATLSGGEMRRLALARAFVLAPSVLLLDEPFDALDAAGQAALSLDLRRVIEETEVAVAVVTHDLRRAMLLADRVAVLLDGRLAQLGTREQVLESPRDSEVARVVGMVNLVRGRVVARQSAELARVEVGGAQHLPCASDLPVGSEVWVGIRPEHLKIDVGRGEVDPVGKAVVHHVVSDGVVASVTLEWAGVRLQAHLLAGRGLARSLAPGKTLSLSVSPDHVHVMPADTGRPPGPENVTSGATDPGNRIPAFRAER